MLSSSKNHCLESSLILFDELPNMPKSKTEDQNSIICNINSLDFYLFAPRAKFSASLGSSATETDDQQSSENSYDQSSDQKQLSDDSFNFSKDIKILEDYYSMSDAQSSKSSSYIMPKVPKLWTSEEDNLLKKLGVTYKNDWKKIVKRFVILRGIKKSPTFLRERFRTLMSDMAQTKSKFNHEEDLKIVELIELHGMNWVELAKALPNRGPIMIKNRYYSYIRKNNLYDSLIEESKKKTQDDDHTERVQKPKAAPQASDCDFIEYSSEALEKDALRDIGNILSGQRVASQIREGMVLIPSVLDVEAILGK